MSGTAVVITTPRSVERHPVPHQDRRQTSSVTSGTGVAGVEVPAGRSILAPLSFAWLAILFVTTRIQRRPGDQGEADPAGQFHKPAAPRQRAFARARREPVLARRSQVVALSGCSSGSSLLLSVGWAGGVGFSWGSAPMSSAPTWARVTSAVDPPRLGTETARQCPRRRGQLLSPRGSGALTGMYARPWRSRSQITDLSR